MTLRDRIDSVYATLATPPRVGRPSERSWFSERCRDITGYYPSPSTYWRWVSPDEDDPSDDIKDLMARALYDLEERALRYRQALERAERIKG